MRYSLTNRIRGTLIGGMVGQTLGNVGLAESFNCSLAVQGMQSLIAQGGFDLEDWDRLVPSLSNKEIAADFIFLNLIWATLPIALFFHEDRSVLRKNLLLAIKTHNHPLDRDGILTVCYLIAQSLNDKINTDTIVSEITSFIGETKTGIPKLLQQVNNIIIKNAGYSELQNCLDKENSISNIIAIAFYCFVTTKEDFRLTCLRAVENQQNSRVSGAIAGIISGAYNSMTGIPVTWHLGLDEAKLAQWGLTSFSQVVKLADAFVAVWSGTYDVLPQVLELQEVGKSNLIPPLEAIAAPHIIRLR
ncbi:ADP-ribosylglycohydrolase [Rivularia sp. PCC 7116]|uniref:ADP-ribosylglycohydrolase family protein n=1 Tax=Rivularia sp. PCC 7116 TaxID=373994 RepID=UPI00029EDF5A|nr:ADP-ribosylglycohydrolase family protein [Rivularia sp. PCC 7116]AFY59177.1 ADP-ribosylglycohydrolase [Rivularia sp. PCC 7116]